MAGRGWAPCSRASCVQGATRDRARLDRLQCSSPSCDPPHHPQGRPPELWGGYGAVQGSRDGGRHGGRRGRGGLTGPTTGQLAAWGCSVVTAAGEVAACPPPHPLPPLTPLLALGRGGRGLRYSGAGPGGPEGAGRHGLRAQSGGRRRTRWQGAGRGEWVGVGGWAVWWVSGCTACRLACWCMELRCGALCLDVGWRCGFVLRCSSRMCPQPPSAGGVAGALGGRKHGHAGGGAGRLHRAGVAPSRAAGPSRCVTGAARLAMNGPREAAAAITS